MQREIYEFGPYVLDSAQMLLRRDGNVVQLQPRALEMLLVLVRGRGELVSKQDLMNAVWPDSFVEEGNLTQNIFLLRRELGRTAEGEDYIQTLSKRGYRMNVPVKENGRTLAAEKVADDPGQDSNGHGAAVFAASAGEGRSRRVWLVAALLVLAMLGLGVAAAGLWRVESARPRVSGYTQITHDGALKRGS